LSRARAAKVERPQRGEVASALVLPDLEHRGADVPVAIEVDRAERPLVVHVLAGLEQPYGLAEGEERDLRAGRPRDRTEVRLDPRRGGGARLHGGEERDGRGVHGEALEDP